MRPLSVTLDDLAIQAAETKLAEIASREGFAKAMEPRPTGSRREQLGALAFAALCAGLLVATVTRMPHGFIVYVLAVVLFAFVVMSLLLAIGSAPRKPTRAFSAAVIGTSLEQRKTGSPEDDNEPRPRVLLLDAGGVRAELVTASSIYELLKTGDVGVAHERGGELVSFVRL